MKYIILILLNTNANAAYFTYYHNMQTSPCDTVSLQKIEALKTKFNLKQISDDQFVLYPKDKSKTNGMLTITNTLKECLTLEQI